MNNILHFIHFKQLKLPRGVTVAQVILDHFVIVRIYARQPLPFAKEGPVDDADRERFLSTLGEACGKTGWQVHGFCLMDNHFHLVVETPEANLVAGMKWMLGTYTQRFNAKHRMRGHLFAGRSKALLVDESDDFYLRTVCD